MKSKRNGRVCRDCHKTATGIDAREAHDESTRTVAKCPLCNFLRGTYHCDCLGDWNLAQTPVVREPPMMGRMA